MGQANRGKELMVFDWVKAAQIIAKRKPKTAIAGLSSDMEWTAGEIWSFGGLHVFVIYLGNTSN